MGHLNRGAWDSCLGLAAQAKVLSALRAFPLLQKETQAPERTDYFSLPMDLFSISEKLAGKFRGSICRQPDRSIGSFLN